jgi:hypothetical protein
MERKWPFLLSTLGIWVMYVAMMFCTVRALPMLDSLTLVDALFLTLAGALSSLVPVPGGFGAFHIVVSTAISYVYGIPVEIGLIFATLSHESQILTQILSGGIAYADEARQIDLRF